MALIIAITLLPIAAAWALDPPQPARAAFLRSFSSVVQAPPRHIEKHIGMVAVNNGKTQIRVAYLPMLAPLSGSAIGVTERWPNPFELLNTPIAMSQRQWERK
jgi:hypothetical protein